MGKIKNLILGIGIVVIFALVLWQGIEAFYPSPEWNDFCEDIRTQVIIETREMCEEIGGQWNFYDGTRPKPINGEEIANGWCNIHYNCQKNYESARDSYSQVVFYISLIVAVIVFIIGFLILKVEPVGSALMASGVWAIFWGSLFNWRNFSTISRFLLLLFALILLIWIAVRLNTEKKQGFLRKLFRK